MAEALQIVKYLLIYWVIGIMLIAWISAPYRMDNDDYGLAAFLVLLWPTTLIMYTTFKLFKVVRKLAQTMRRGANAND